jgi:spermidine/putrescine transport system permease protein
MVKKIASRVYMGLIFLFLYLPIVVLIVLSFNNSKSKVKWGGFTLDWYIKCFQSERIMSAFSTTLQITLLAAVISTIIGTLAAMGISAMKKRNQTIYLGATNIPMLNADIVTGISMMLLFVKFMNLGFVTVLIAHITFNIPYVILNVLPKLKQTNKYTYEAALDLGASPLYAFFKVTWPEISPGVFSGFMMAVTMSLDDFSITYFTKGAGVNTLSTMLYTELKKGVKPELYALSTILFFTVLLLLVVVNINSNRIPVSSSKKPARAKKLRIVKRSVSIAIVAVLVIGCFSVFTISAGGTNNDNAITVLNYGKYIDESVIDSFEQETGITIKYEEYEEPEEMYTKYKSGAIDYDVICTSDYIIEKLINEGEVNKIDYSSMPNYQNVNQDIIDMSASFDPTHEYTVPYFYGTLGILYNKKMADASDLNTWDCLWNGKYKDNMIMINSVRDAFTPALRTLGYSINETDTAKLDEAFDILNKQSSDVLAYYVDETCDEMVAENAAIAVCYSGEAAAAMAENDNLDYIVPKEGSNLWIDSWFIPKTCKNKEGAQEFLNYICGDEPARLNFEYVYYASPIQSVIDNQDAETKENEAINPPSDMLKNCEVYRALNDEDATLYNTLWQRLKSD